jgi:hypothetical protein
VNTSIDKLLEKYWHGQTTQEEENQINRYFSSDAVAEKHAPFIPLFGFFEIERKVVMNADIDIDSITKPVKSSSLRLLVPRMLAIAASLLILVSIGMHLFKADDTLYKNKYTELQDPDEALAITIEALGFLSNKYESGSQPMTKYMKNFEQTAIVKFN